MVRRVTVTYSLALGAHRLTKALSVYPPPDYAVAGFICTHFVNERDCEKTMQAFLYGLFRVTTEHLAQLAIEGDTSNAGMCPRSSSRRRPDPNPWVTDMTIDERVTQFASRFRKRMNEGMKFGQHGQYRVEFFKSVVKEAQEVSVH